MDDFDRLNTIHKRIMNMPTEYENKIPLLLQVFIWLIPLNIYVIGDWFGSGIQWAVFRYQQAFFNGQNTASLILYNREMMWILQSTITGKTVYSILLWGLGIALLCLGTILILNATLQRDGLNLRRGALVNCTGAFAFIGAIVIQYGITLQGPAGIAIPFGIPVILGVAYYQYHGDWTKTESENENEDNEVLDTT